MKCSSTISHSHYKNPISCITFIIGLSVNVLITATKNNDNNSYKTDVAVVFYVLGINWLDGES